MPLGAAGPVSPVAVPYRVVRDAIGSPARTGSGSDESGRGTPNTGSSRDGPRRSDEGGSRDSGSR